MKSGNSHNFRSQTFCFDQLPSLFFSHFQSSGTEHKKASISQAERVRSKIVPACLRSWGFPDLAKTSRSTRLMDMRPKVRPDISPANKTKNTITTMWMKKPLLQHSYSTAIKEASFKLSLLSQLPKFNRFCKANYVSISSKFRNKTLFNSEKHLHCWMINLSSPTDQTPTPSFRERRRREELISGEWWELGNLYQEVAFSITLFFTPIRIREDQMRSNCKK